MKKWLILNILIFFATINIVAGNAVCDSMPQEVKNSPINQYFLQTALYHLNKPYVDGTLEINSNETLVINSSEFDCTTFVEYCLAWTFANKDTQQDLSQFLTKIRYRNGIIDGYTSRLHYMTEWIENGNKNHYFKDITSNLGGKYYIKQLNFMSQHPNSYKHLKTSEANIEEIKQIENSLNKHRHCIIPKTSILEKSKLIKDGDIILFSTKINGLDYTHLGIAMWESKVLKFIHASSQYKKVVISNKSLNAYCQTSKNCDGITILRLQEIKRNE